MSDVTTWRRRFKRALADGIKGKRTTTLARDYDVPERLVAFWRKKPSYVNYDDPLHKAAAACRTRMVAWRKRFPDTREPPTVAQIRESLDDVGDRCELCGNRMFDDLSVDHMRPLSRGGRNAIENLILVHKRCNEAKGDLRYGEYMRLREAMRGYPAAWSNIESRLIAGGARRYGK